MKTWQLCLIDIIILYVFLELNIWGDNWISIGLYFFSVLGFLYFMQFVPEAILSTSYDSVEGEIIKSEKGSYSSSNVGYSYPTVEYKFTIKGTEYTSERIQIGSQSMATTDHDWTEEFLEKYPLGQKVIVYYDPRNPEKRSILEKGFHMSNLWIFLIVAVILFFFASMVGVLFDRALTEEIDTSLIYHIFQLLYMRI